MDFGWHIPRTLMIVLSSVGQCEPKPLCENPKAAPPSVTTNY